MRRAALLILLLSTACGPGRAPVVVDRMDVTLTVLIDGSVQADERLSTHVDGARVSTIRRRTPVFQHDGVFDVSATMDGKSVARGSGPGHVQIGNGPDLDVRWTFDPAAGGAHVFGLTYRAANAVGLNDVRGSLAWLVLPARRDFEVGQMSVTLTLPDSAVLLADPWVEEPGWTVTRLPHGMRAERTNVPRGAGATVGVEFSTDGLAASTPRWQSDFDLREQFIPAFISAGLFILVVAAGILWMLRLKFPRWRIAPDAAADVAPDAAPAVRVAIARGRCRGDRAELAAAIDGLVRKGAVTADGDRLRLVNAAAAHAAHEQIVTHELWLRKSEGLTAGALGSRRTRRALRRALTTDLVSGGWADRERVEAARDLGRAGLVVTIVGVVAWVVVAIAMRQFGAWPLAVPCSLVISGLMFLAGAARFDVLSAHGAKARVLYFARVLDGRTSS
jgi:hypothetical protein